MKRWRLWKSQRLIQHHNVQRVDLQIQTRKIGFEGKDIPPSHRFNESQNRIRVSSVWTFALWEQIFGRTTALTCFFLMLELCFYMSVDIHSTGSLQVLDGTIYDKPDQVSCQQGHQRFDVLTLTSFFLVLIQNEMLLIRGITRGQCLHPPPKSHLPNRTVASIPCFLLPLVQLILYFPFNVIRYMIFLVSLTYIWQD